MLRTWGLLAHFVLILIVFPQFSYSDSNGVVNVYKKNSDTIKKTASGLMTVFLPRLQLLSEAVGMVGGGESNQAETPPTPTMNSDEVKVESESAANEADASVVKIEELKDENTKAAKVATAQVQNECQSKIAAAPMSAPAVQTQCQSDIAQIDKIEKETESELSKRKAEVADVKLKFLSFKNVAGVLAVGGALAVGASVLSQDKSKEESADSVKKHSSEDSPTRYKEEKQSDNNQEIQGVLGE